MAEFFVVWKHDGGSPTVRHQNYASAYRECERLARLHKAKFHVLRVVCTMAPVDINVDGPTPEDYEQSEIQF